MSKRGTGGYIGGHTVVRDPGFLDRVAHRQKKTREHEAKIKREHKRPEAERKAYEEAPSDA
jgi:hypothetical protein